MADAPGAEAFFLSLPLFFDPSACEAAIEAGLEGTVLAQPALTSQEGQVLLQWLSLSEDRIGLVYRWTGHLADVLSSVGGFVQHHPMHTDEAPATYIWRGELPSLAPRHMAWQDVPASSIAQYIVLAGEMALLIALEQWRDVGCQRPLADRLVQALDDYRQLAAAQLDSSIILPIPERPMRKFLAADHPRRLSLFENIMG